jgi:hypothetical protein
MSNVYRFIYDSSVSEAGPYPISTSVKVVHHFDESTAWTPILWQFAKFLESTGYVGVCDKIVIKDPKGCLMMDGAYFERIGETSLYDYEEDEEEDEEENEDSELDLEDEFRDMKKEVS